jgi:hypothetical protein
MSKIIRIKWKNYTDYNEAKNCKKCLYVFLFEKKVLIHRKSLEVCVKVQRQLEKQLSGVTEWACWFWRLILRCSLTEASFWSRAAKMAFSLP